MKRINIYIAGAFLTILTFFSCKKDFLDVPPTNSGDANSYLKSAADAKVAINGIMRSMLSSSYYGRNFVLYGDAKGGDLTVFSQGRGLDNLFSFNHATNSGAYGDFWSTSYSIIVQINAISVHQNLPSSHSIINWSPVPNVRRM